MADNLFILISALVIASAFWVVFSPNLIHSAVSLLFTLFSTAGLYIFLYADFIAATQVVIYVGGILVLIIFGVMLTSKIETPSIAASSKNQFIGGMGIIVFSIAILPMLGMGGVQLFRAEIAGPVANKLTPRVKQTAKLL